MFLGVKKFLEEREVSDRPLLLGYSGGPDSRALLKLLSECRRFFSFELHLAHVDHGWREESKREAQEIAREADELGYPLHIQALGPEDFSSGNWEEQGREHRLKFFSRIYERIGAQALVLGHHADDQAEVVLKRVFEGASLFSMGGLASESSLMGMQVWRPLLSVQKKDVLQWLSQNNISWFQDPTNSDPRFLRGKMREEMLPSLRSSFGKEVSSNLCRLGEESREVKAFFSELNRPIIACIQKAEGVHNLDLNPFLPLPLLQMKYLLREWFSVEGVTFSRQILESVASAVLSRATGKKFLSGEGEIQVEKGFLCFFKNLKQMKD